MQWEWDMGDQDQEDMMEVDMSGCAQIDVVGMGHGWSGSNWCSGGRRWAIRLKLIWWEWDMSGCTWIDAVGVGDEWSGLKRHGGGGDKQLGLKRCGGGRQAIGREKTWWRQEMSNCTQIDMVGLTRWGRGQAIRCKKTWWGLETSGCVRIDAVEVEHRRARKGLVDAGDSRSGPKRAGAQMSMVEAGYISKPALGWTGLDSLDSLLADLPNKVPNWLALPRLFHTTPSCQRLGKYH